MDSKMRRHNQILSLLSRQSRLSVNELSDVLGTSAATVRKDLAALEERQLIRREQGYASLETENPISRRMAFHYAAKSEIASSAADLVRDGDTVFIESGSTCILLAEELRRRKTTVNIVTNSVFMAAYLKETGHLRLTLTGGDYQSDSMALVGPLAGRSLSNFHVKYFGSVTFSVGCRVPVIVPTADVEDLQEEVFVIWIAIALPPECFDLVVQSFDLSG